MAGGISNAQQGRYSEALSSFASDSKVTLQTILTDKKYRGRIHSSDVAALMRTEQLSREALMLKLLPLAKSFAHPPLSNYFVGAVALGTSGSLYLGCNVEIPGNILGLAVHAEQAAVANAYMSDESGVEALTAGGAPCGHCRQFLNETSLDGWLRLIMRDGSAVKLMELLPQAFGPRNLGFTQGSFPVKHARLSLASGSSDALVVEALKAACASHSPYSRSPSGVALLASSGRAFSGSYIENVAFNPSLPPLETALAGYFAAGLSAGDIQRAILVEGERSPHQPATHDSISAGSPGSFGTSGELCAEQFLIGAVRGY